MNVLADPGPQRIHPLIDLSDRGAAHWLGQAILRLRREAAWQRHLSAGQPGLAGDNRDDPAQTSFDLVRHHAARDAFFLRDPTANYLTRQIAALPEPPREGSQGSWAWLVRTCGLSEGECFALGLALAARIDASLGPIFAACLEDRSRPWPTVALAQRLWPDPLAVLSATDEAGRLLRFGLLLPPAERVPDPPLVAPAWLACWIAGDRAPDSFGLTPIGTNASPTGQASAPQRLEIVPVVTNPDADFEGIVGKIAAEARRSCVAARTAESLARSLHIAWLSNTDCALGEPVTDMSQLASIVADLRNNAGLGVRVFLHVADNDLVRHLPAGCTGPVIDADLIDQDEREAILIASLGAHATDLGAEVAQVARDFRLQHRRLRRVAASVTARPGGPRQGDLTAACQAEIHVDLHGLAERVTPRFRPDDIVLPPAIAAQLAEVRLAIRNSGRVYYEWGAAEAMAEGGIALLFSGAPGTGKTMAAEVLAAELDLPLYRIDLSQVVNKYIGETEKNLKRVFDATEASRAILFFDEADALFGKRTEVKDANDRFANVETGYLLQRMERYRGVAILATNRRRDLDEAFSRRLRYAIEFPVPSVAERDSIWRRVFPPRVDLSLLDIPFLARQFQLSGGHIRSIAFNACLQAAETAEPRVTMREVLIATRRELDKLGWTSRAELFGRYATEIEELHA